MKCLAALALGLCFALSALAGPVTVTWTNPTTYADDSALALADITQTRVEYGSCSGTNTFGVKAGEVVLKGNGTQVSSPSLAPATYCFRAYTTAKGVESIASIVASKVVPQSAPNPPALVTIQVVAGINMTPVFQYANGVRSDLLGFLPIRTQCTGSRMLIYRGQNYYAVPASAVKWWGRAPAKGNLIAACA